MAGGKKWIERRERNCIYVLLLQPGKTVGSDSDRIMFTYYAQEDHIDIRIANFLSRVGLTCKNLGWIRPILVDPELERIEYDDQI